MPELAGDGAEQKAPVEIGSLAKLARIHFLELALETLQALDLGIDRESGVIRNLAVIFVQPESDSERRPRGEIASGEIERDLLELRLRAERFRGGRGRFWRRGGGQRENRAEQENDEAKPAHARFHRAPA